MTKNKFAETELYEPIKQLLASQGFTVKGEVKKCDIAAMKDDQLWVVEMKLHFNVTLLYQAMERLKITESVFVAVPRPRRENDKNYRAMIKILTKLELGLITVSLDSPVRIAEIILFPREGRGKRNKAAATVRKEMENRIGDTAGGTNAAGSTAYRERCIRVACLLAVHGPTGARELIHKYSCEKDAHSILYQNFYGWFGKAGRGLYSLTEAGSAYLEANAGNGVVAYYRMKAEENL